MYEKFVYDVKRLEVIRDRAIQFANQCNFIEQAEVPKMTHLTLPLTLIDTRDCFAYDLIAKEEIVNLGPGRDKVLKKTYYFDPECVPDNFAPYASKSPNTNTFRKGTNRSFPGRVHQLRELLHAPGDARDGEGN
jgi:hypothetical protein